MQNKTDENEEEEEKKQKRDVNNVAFLRVLSPTPHSHTLSLSPLLAALKQRSIFGI